MVRERQRPNNIRGALDAPDHRPDRRNGPFTTTNSPFTLLYRPVAAASNTRTYNTGGAWITTNFTFSEGSGASTLTSYNAVAGRFWNGEVIDVIASGASAGQVCDVTFPTAAQRTNPPTITVRGVASLRRGADARRCRSRGGGPSTTGTTTAAAMASRSGSTSSPAT